MTIFPTGAGIMFPYDKFSDVTLYQWGHMYCISNYSFGPFAWEYYLFHYVISGKGVLYSTDSNGEIKEYSLKAGQGFMIWPGQYNKYQADEKEPWEYAWVEFDGLLARELVVQAGLEYNSPVYDANGLDAQSHFLCSAAL